MDSSLVIIERKHSFAIIRLNLSEESNGLSRETIVTLRQAFENLENQPDLRAIILAGPGDGAFSAETDIAEKPADDTQFEVRENSQQHQALYDQITTCSVPVIVAVDGLTAGDDLELTLACHLRIAHPNASFRFPKVRLDSLAGQAAVHQLAREIGNKHALEICRSGQTVPAEEALRIGLINRLAPEGRLLIEAESLARQISTMAPLAIRACLEAVTRGMELPLIKGLTLESQLFAGLFATNDVREGTNAFLEKRKPVFKGS